MISTLDMSKQENFTSQLNYYLGKKGVTKSVLAASLGVLPALVEEWCSGSRLPDEKTIKKIASFFDADIEEFTASDSSSKKAETKVVKTKKRLVLGHCARCGKPILEGDVYGTGKAEKVIKSEFLKNPVEEIVYTYDPKVGGYDYFCESCCDFLLEEQKLKSQKATRERITSLSKTQKRAVLSGILTAIIALFATFVFAWNGFKLFKYSLSLRYEVALTFAALLLGYLTFSFVYVALSNNTWIGRGISGAAKYFYAVPIKKIFKSENTVLYMGTVKVIVAGSFAAFVSIVFVPFCFVMSLFSAFGWGVARKRLKEELVKLQATLN
jgi:transcriptional regulator with XRE-family HTH domain